MISAIFTSCNSSKNEFYYPVDDSEFLEVDKLSQATKNKNLESAFIKALEELNNDRYSFTSPQEILGFDEYENILYFVDENKNTAEDFNIPYVCSKTNGDKGIIDFYVNFVPESEYSEKEADNQYLYKLYLEKNTDGVWEIVNVFIPA